jgi:hypothetical protein
MEVNLEYSWSEKMSTCKCPHCGKILEITAKKSDSKPVVKKKVVAKKK